MPRYRAHVVLASALLAARSLAAAPAPWVEVKSSHFTVVTNSGEKEGRHTAWQFEQIRGALLRLWPWARIDGGKPFLVFAVRDEATLRTLGPQYWEGRQVHPISFWTGSRDRHFVAVRTDLREPDDLGSNPYQQAYWAYAYAIFTRSFPRPVPTWYSRGIAEVISNTIVREKEIHVGRPMQANLDLLRQQPTIPLAELLSADARSHWRTRENDAQLYDAQVWALVHYLLFGEQGANAGKVSQFNRLLFAGTAPDVAIKEAFGDLAPYYAAVRTYESRNLFRYAKVELTAGPQPEAYAMRPLSAAETAALRGQFLVAMRRPVEARAAAAEARQSDPALAEPWEIEADLLEAEDKDAEAKAAYAKAAAAGSKRADVYHRLAQLEWTKDADKPQLQHLADTLEKARALDPQDAGVVAFLANVRVDLEQYPEALTLASKAVEMEPSASYNRVVLARVLARLDRRDEAVHAAQAALGAADDDSERHQAQEMIDFLARESRVFADANPTSTIVDAWPADSEHAGTTRVRGPAAKAIIACFHDRSAQDCAEALPALEGACAAGQPVACRSLGSVYDGGVGVTADKAHAARSYGRACELGDKPSCARRADLQARGQGLPRDARAAAATLERLCQDGLDEACLSWAVVLLNGQTRAGLARARVLLDASCKGGNDEACRLLKSMPPR